MSSLIPARDNILYNHAILNRLLKVGAGENIKTIEAAAERLHVVAPDPDDKVFIYLVDPAYQLVDDQIVMPANSGILAADPITDNTLITGTSGRGQGANSACFLVNSNNQYMGFKIISDPTNSGSAFGSIAGTTGDITFSKLNLTADGDDSFYLFGGGNYLIEGCKVGVGFDGIAVFGSDVDQVVTVDHSYLYGKAGPVVPNNLIRVDNANALVNVNNSWLELHPSGTMVQPVNCIGSGISGVNPVAYDLSVDNTVFRTYGFSDVDADHGFKNMVGIQKRTGRMDLKGSEFIMVNGLFLVENNLQDAALWLTDQSNLTTGISDTRIHLDTMTLAQAQVDAGGNGGLSGFEIT